MLSKCYKNILSITFANSAVQTEELMFSANIYILYPKSNLGLFPKKCVWFRAVCLWSSCSVSISDLKLVFMFKINVSKQRVIWAQGKFRAIYPKKLAGLVLTKCLHEIQRKILI